MKSEGTDGSRVPNWPPRWLPLVAILLVTVLWPIVMIGAQRAWLKSKNRVEDWLPDGFAETKSLREFEERFGGDEFLMISWPGCTLNDPRAERLTELLRQPAEDGKVLFLSADSGSQIVESMIQTRKFTEEQAKRRLSGIFVGKDGLQTCVIACVSDVGASDRKKAVDYARRTAEKATELPASEIHIAGTTADSVAVDEASNAWLIELNVLSYFVCFGILIISIRNIWLVGTVFLTAMLNQQLALAVIYYSGGHVDSVQLLVANLSFVLTISAGLHYLGYFRDAIRSKSLSPARLALQQAFLPSMLAAITTSLGFVSLCTSELVPIRSFGFYSAILVPINSLVVITLLTIHSTWAVNRNWRFQSIAKLNALSPMDDKQEKHSDVWSRVCIPLLRRRPLMIIFVWVTIMLTAGWGVTKLTTNVGTHQLLPPDSKLIKDYAWLEQHVGPLVPVELVVSMPELEDQNASDLLIRLQTLDELQDRFREVEGIEGTFSALNLIPALPTKTGIGGSVRRSLIGAAVLRSADKFQEMRFLYEDEQRQYWRISGRISGSRNRDFEALLANCQTMMDRFAAEPGHESMRLDLSGGVPFVYRTQRQLLADLLNSFSSAFAMIALSMAILFRSVMGGLLTMLPNLTPAAIVFGLMGWNGLSVEIGTVLTASVMMGVCVDDTLHLVSHFRQLRQKGLSHDAAVSEALSNCGGAMLQTALVCGLGMLVFSLSPFTPVARFAWLTFTLLMVGVVSDLMLTPAMLLSPLHHLFYWERRPKTQPRVSIPTTHVSSNVA
ncbi:MAG: efflux RND transporter permease subunit [Pirellula sp.]